MSESQVFRVDGVEITVSADAVDASPIQEFAYHGRAVTAVAREFADTEEE